MAARLEEAGIKPAAFVPKHLFAEVECGRAGYSKTYRWTGRGVTEE
jgi:hypothetical protein